MSSYINLYDSGDRMEIKGITPVLCSVCSEIAGKPDCGALAGSFNGKQYRVELCRSCFMTLLGTAREMRRATVMFAASDVPNDDFGLKHE